MSSSRSPRIPNRGVVNRRPLIEHISCGVVDRPITIVVITLFSVAHRFSRQGPKYALMAARQSQQGALMKNSVLNRHIRNVVEKRKTTKIMKGPHQGMERPVNVIIAVHCGWQSKYVIGWAAITAETSVGVPQRRLGAMGISYLMY